MKFLSVLGQIIIQGTKIVTGLGPLFPQQSQLVGKVEDILTKVAEVVINVESFGQALGVSGPDKLKAATPAVTQLLLKSNLLDGKKIKDATLFATGVSKVTSGIVDILNSLDEDSIKTTSAVKP